MWIVYNNEERVVNESLLVLQGSYGVVKLAYNEDDDKYYVSRSVSSRDKMENAVETQEVYSITVIDFLFSILLNCFHLPWRIRLASLSSGTLNFI